MTRFDQIVSFLIFSQSNQVTNCFIDGTCRSEGLIFKDNGDAQAIYDLTLILMLLGFACFLVFAHMAMIIRSKRYAPFYGRYWLTLASGTLTVLLVTAALCLFGIGVPDKLNLGKLFGKKMMHGSHFAWGANVGWFMAILAMAVLIPAIGYLSTKKERYGYEPIRDIPRVTEVRPVETIIAHRVSSKETLVTP